MKSLQQLKSRKLGTYVTVHSYTAKAIQNAIRGSIRNVDTAR